MTDQDTEIRALAAMTGTQGEMPQTRAEKDVLMAGMIAVALGRGMSWAQIGSVLGGISGREAKRKAHRLARKTNARLRQQAVSAQIAGGSADG